MLTLSDFFIDPRAGLPILSGGYDLGRVLLSILIATCSSIVALQVAGMGRNVANARQRHLVIAAGTVALGGGVWAMHFIGMLAFQLCVTVRYDPIITLLSALPSLAASWVALLLLSQPAIHSRQLVTGGVLIGGGIGAMHYSGMAAMQMSALLRFDPFWFTLSVLLAIALAMLALWIRFRLQEVPRLRGWRNTMLSGAVMGAAITGMHYLGMHAARFLGNAESQAPFASSDALLALNGNQTLALLVALGALILLSAVFLGSGAVRARQVFQGELRDREMQYRSLIANLPGAAFRKRMDNRTDASPSMQFISDGIEALSGWSASDFIGGNRSVHNLIHPDDRLAVEQTVADAVARCERYAVEYRLQRRDGGELWVWESASVTRDERDGPIWVDGVILDISARHQMEAELRTAKETAEQANAAKSIFLSTISHEIRTPMNGVLGMADLLKETPLDARQEEYVAAIGSSAEALLAIINDILDLSRIDAGKLRLESIDTSLYRIAVASIQVFEQKAEDKGLRLRCDIDDKLPPVVRTDPGRLRQVLLNLLSNAVKFTEAGEVELQVRTLSRNDSTCRVRFAVRDTGIGIDLAKRELLFQPFQQLDGSVTRKYGGTGLGLSICKRLVELMGGAIGFDSAPGSGSTFWCELTLDIAAPIEESEEETRSVSAVRIAPRSTLAVIGPQASEPAEPAEPLEAETIDARLLLLVEDNDINQRVAISQLHRLGYRVHVARNGAEALNAITTQRFALVLMDCQMPVMDGFQATREIRTREQNSGTHLPIIAMTANAMQGDRQRCLEAGMDDYVAKPVSMQTLSMVLERWLPAATATMA